jgi:hypothetical protein
MQKLWRRSSQTQTLRVSKTLRVFSQVFDLSFFLWYSEYRGEYHALCLRPL